MAVTSSSFFVEYPEFKGANTAMVDAHLTRSIAAVKGEMSESDRDTLVKLDLADTLARSPFAKDLKLVASDGSTVYSQARRRLLTKVTLHRRF